MRLAYAITDVRADSSHYLHWQVHGSWYNNLVDAGNPPMQGFLILFENIETDADLIWAARQCWFRLHEWGIIKY